MTVFRSTLDMCQKELDQSAWWLYVTLTTYLNYQMKTLPSHGTSNL